MSYPNGNYDPNRNYSRRGGKGKWVVGLGLAGAALYLVANNSGSPAKSSAEEFVNTGIESSEAPKPKPTAKPSSAPATTRAPQPARTAEQTTPPKKTYTLPPVKHTKLQPRGTKEYHKPYDFGAEVPQDLSYQPPKGSVPSSVSLKYSWTVSNPGATTFFVDAYGADGSSLYDVHGGLFKGIILQCIDGHVADISDGLKVKRSFMTTTSDVCENNNMTKSEVAGLPNPDALFDFQDIKG